MFGKSKRYLREQRLKTLKEKLRKEGEIKVHYDRILTSPVMWEFYHGLVAETGFPELEGIWEHQAQHCTITAPEVVKKRKTLFDIKKNFVVKSLLKFGEVDVMLDGYQMDEFAFWVEEKLAEELKDLRIASQTRYVHVQGSRFTYNIYNRPLITKYQKKKAEKERAAAIKKAAKEKMDRIKKAKEDAKKAKEAMELQMRQAAEKAAQEQAFALLVSRCGYVNTPLTKPHISVEFNGATHYMLKEDHDRDVAWTKEQRLKIKPPMVDQRRSGRTTRIKEDVKKVLLVKNDCSVCDHFINDKPPSKQHNYRLAKDILKEIDKDSRFDGMKFKIEDGLGVRIVKTQSWYDTQQKLEIEAVQKEVEELWKRIHEIIDESISKKQKQYETGGLINAIKTPVEQLNAALDRLRKSSTRVYAKPEWQSMLDSLLKGDIQTFYTGNVNYAAELVDKLMREYLEKTGHQLKINIPKPCQYSLLPAPKTVVEKYERTVDGKTTGIMKITHPCTQRRFKITMT
jgi:gas vesicle protein